MQPFQTNSKRASADLLSAFGEQEAATVHEANHKEGAMDRSIRPIYPEIKMCGSALTVRCQGADNPTLHAAIAMARPGDVIVADVGDACEAGHWGEITTVAAQARGVVGLVINGGVRDIAPIRARRFPIFSASVSMKATVKATPGLINHPVVCGGVLVHPGDVVLGDDDGVVVVPLARAEEVLAAARQRLASEEALIEKIEAGAVTLDLLGFRQILEERGVQIPENGA